MRAKHSLSLRMILSLKIGPQGGTQAYRGPLLPTLSRSLELSTGCSLRLCAADRTKSEVGKRPLLLLFLLLLPWGSETRRAMCAAMQHRP